ncbi:MAG TPA: CAP domain-containing protein [Xanthobacteraceae bacterium]|nr:CAP domain-containing protein [Xanthobacteraceae bacterium]
MRIRRRIAGFCLIALALSAAASVARASDLNGFRAAHGRKALKVSAHLSSMAYAHAYDLARRGALDHAGFFTSRGPDGATAENVSYGCASESCAIAQWAASAHHRANMLRTDVSSYGLGSALSSSGTRYWVMELGGGAPPPARGRTHAYLEEAVAAPPQAAHKKR